MFKVLDDNIGLLLEPGLLLFQSLQLAVQLIDLVLQTKDLVRCFLLQVIKVLHMKSGLILILVLPVLALILGLANHLLQFNTEDSFLFILSSDVLDLRFQVLDGVVSLSLHPGQGINIVLQVLDSSTQFVLVQATGLNGQLHLIQPLVGFLVLLLQPLLSCRNLDHSLVELFNLGTVILNVDFQFLNHFPDGDLLLAEDLNLGNQFADVHLELGIFFGHLLLGPRHLSDLFLKYFEFTVQFQIKMIKTSIPATPSWPPGASSSRYESVVQTQYALPPKASSTWPFQPHASY